MTERQLRHLAAAMAHEVRNPLNSMAIHAELVEGRLRRNALDDADREALLRSARLMASEVERIDRILEEYLDFAGPDETARKSVEAARLIADAVEQARPQAKAREVGIEVRAKEGMGRWLVDAEAIGDALEAVLANAIQASPHGGVVEIGVSADNDSAEIVVDDRGDGIAAEDLPRVFQLGFSRHGKAGLGLTVAKQIIKGHGGSIVCESAGVGQGARVTIRLPIEADA
jgi:two-component system, sporulation sensor kinase E